MSINLEMSLLAGSRLERQTCRLRPQYEAERIHVVRLSDEGRCQRQQLSQIAKRGIGDVVSFQVDRLAMLRRRRFEFHREVHEPLPKINTRTQPHRQRL